MNTIKTILFTAAAASLPLWAEEVTLTPKPIPGTIKANANVPSAGYGSSTVQTQLRVNVRDSDKAVRFVRSNTDPFVITRLYTLKHAEPYALRGYLLSVVQGTKLGIVIGLILGVGLVLLQQEFGLVRMPGSFIVSAYPVVLKLSDMLWTLAGVCLVGWLVSFFPSRKLA